MIQPISIRDYVVRMPDTLNPYLYVSQIQIRQTTAVDPAESGWQPFSVLADEYFRPAFNKRNPLNIPGPFYGAETDTCETGIAAAPHNVLLDASGQEYVFAQPTNENELRNILVAAMCECFLGYGADGDNHWSLTLIREWWRSRRDLLALASHDRGLPESKQQWERILSGEGISYLRSYAFFVENHRLPSETETLPEID